ncbi:MFS general substrate transporter [Crucibulum laeve]|uniref:MFS general substrate transporter n=1 Tax=Crucibulum laeve TaxID=68775 RepID=A0A5C3MD57_9AGAR|nr:MFS general substrate transporter [Crucibulum laeve]
MSSTKELESSSENGTAAHVLPEDDSELQKKAVRKLDYTILPVMTMFYLLSFLDRANIGNARIAGLQKSLHLTDHQYQICVTVLYVPYIAAELPSNLLLRTVGPRLLMPTLLTLWGIIVTLQGLVTSYGGLIAVRTLLGMVEGPMFPGIVLYLSSFYTREELSLRIAFFFSSASLSGAFSGLLAAAIQNMDGVGGKPGWSWIFILEGLFSILMGITGFFLVPSTPRDSKFLTDNQKDIIMRRLEKDRPSIVPSDRFSIREVLWSLRSPHVLLLFVLFFMVGTTLYGLALFLPSIVNQLGFSPVKSQLLSVGPFAVGFFVTLLSAYVSDRYKSRAIPSAVIASLSVIGFAIYLSTKDKFTAYGSLFLTVPGVYASAPTLSAWMANNSEPYYRRATSIALGFVATNAGGILSTWRFPTKEGPRFRNTTIMDLTFSALVVVGSIVNALLLSHMNRSKKLRRDTLLAPYTVDEKNPDGGVKAWMELGDRHPDFTYTL